MSEAQAAFEAAAAIADKAQAYSEKLRGQAADTNDLFKLAMHAGAAGAAKAIAHLIRQEAAKGGK